MVVGQHSTAVHHILAERHVVFDVVVVSRHALGAPTKPEVKNTLWTVGMVFGSLDGADTPGPPVVSVCGHPLLRGWIGYYGRYASSALYPLLRQINQMLVAWVMRKFKRFKGHTVRASQFLQRLAKEQQALFVHWDIGMTGVFN
jgi:hypothetical protein